MPGNVARWIMVRNWQVEAEPGVLQENLPEKPCKAPSRGNTKTGLQRWGFQRHRSKGEDVKPCIGEPGRTKKDRSQATRSIFQASETLGEATAGGERRRERRGSLYCILGEKESRTIKRPAQAEGRNEWCPPGVVYEEKEKTFVLRKPVQ